MLPRTDSALGEAAEWLGDWHPLMDQLGSTDGLVALSSLAVSFRVQPLNDLPALRRFLEAYHAAVLLPVELPAIQRAYTHTTRNELRELIALDQEIACKPAVREFASASRRVGQGQLGKLRPLQDQRFVQRYLRAVDGGQANGWHTLVYGLTLAVYSLPLRQGLMGYATQTTRGFIYSAARSLRFSERECRSLLKETCGRLAGKMAPLLADYGKP
jgi:urease accessory protein UreF